MCSAVKFGIYLHPNTTKSTYCKIILLRKFLTVVGDKLGLLRSYNMRIFDVGSETVGKRKNARNGKCKDSFA